MTGGSGELRVDRLRLQLQGLDDGAARQLVRLVAEHLAEDLRLPVGAGAVEALALDVPARSGEGPDDLARRIAARVGRAIALHSEGFGP